MWINDLFMERVKEDGKWTLFCPDENPGLADCYGDEFRKLYLSYEAKGDGKEINARELWYHIRNSKLKVDYLIFVIKTQLIINPIKKSWNN